MIAALLLFFGQCESTEDALRTFASTRWRQRRRSSDGTAKHTVGVTGPSQIRYVGYFETLLRSCGRAPDPASATNLLSANASRRFSRAKQNSIYEKDADESSKRHSFRALRTIGSLQLPTPRARKRLRFVRLEPRPDAGDAESRFVLVARIFGDGKDRSFAESKDGNGTFRCDGIVLHGDVKFTVLNSDDSTLCFWHLFTEYVPPGATFALTKSEVDVANKDDACEMFSSSFRVVLGFESAPV